jgi:predicted nucleic-acid-binding protein
MKVMVADTNILVRYLVKDDPVQTPVAENWLASHRCYVLKTVVLELVWVLTSKRSYALPKAVVIERLKHLFGLPNVQVEEIVRVVTALKWYEAGMDFADALHLACSQPWGEFVTFDQDLEKQARHLKISPAVTGL